MGSATKQYICVLYQVIRVVHEFRDVEGPLWATALVMFRRCACVDSEGKCRKCVPPKAGYQCQREATLIRMKITLEAEVGQMGNEEIIGAGSSTGSNIIPQPV